MDQHEGSCPASLCEEVRSDVHQVGYSEAGVSEVRGGCVEGPIDYEGRSDDVGAGDESPIAAVIGIFAVVAHGKDKAGRDY